MLRFFSGLFMRRPLLLFLLVGVFPIMIVGLLAYQRAATAMRDSAYTLLDQTRESRRAQIIEYFHDRSETLELLAQLEITHSALDLLEAYEAEYPFPVDGPFRTDEEAYRTLLVRIDQLCAPIVSTDQFHDIFLVDVDHGHVMYSSAQESDLGTNLGTGPLRASGLASAWRDARESKALSLTDMAYYEPSREASMFLALPVLGSTGSTRAVVVAQIGADELQQIMAGTSELGETGEVYLVGQDHKLRSELRFDDDHDANDSLDTETVELALGHEHGVKATVNHRGAPVLSAFSHLGLDDTMGTDFDWGVIAELEEAEALAEARTLAWWLLGTTGAVAMLVLLVAMAVSRALRQQTEELLEGINVIAASGAQISSTSSQLAASAAETASAVSETTVTIEQVKQTTQVSMEKARAVSDTANRSVASSQAGAQAVDRTVARMGGIRQQMETVAESVVRLSEQSQAIGEIIAAVDDLAEQSNLLAVNAAIEAAKAGEHGRGFAVVAQEVKSLAEQSKQATAHVRTILNDIQKATSVAVMATEQGGKAVEAGVEQSSEAGEAIGTLGASIREANQAAAQIAASAQQQYVGVEQVTEAMEGIKIAAEQNEMGARQLEDAVRDLGALGKRLQDLASRYQA
jgi:methyl-accepting chemotaxis protein